MIFVDIYKVNSVDVVDATGSFRHGRVVDVGNDGLFIDFFCPDQRRQFHPFRDVFLSDCCRALHHLGVEDLHAADPASPQRAVEVLVRENPSRPFTWVPATVLPLQPPALHELQSTVVVEYAHPGTEGLQREIFPGEQLRMTLTNWQQELAGDHELVGHRDDAELGLVCVPPGRFVVYRVALPSSLTIAPAALLPAVEAHLKWYFDDYFRAEVNIMPVAVEAGAVVCLELLPLARFDRHKHLTLNPTIFLPKIIRNIATNNLQITPNPTPTDDTSADIRDLPTDLLTEVFSCLNSFVQSRTRRVCSAWADLLDTASLANHLILTDALCARNHEYPLVAVVYKLLRPDTRSLLLTSYDPHEVAPTLFPDFPRMQLIAGMLEFAAPTVGCRLRCVTIANVVWEWQIVGNVPADAVCTAHTEDSASGVRVFAEMCRRLPCEAVKLVGFSAQLVCGFLEVPCPRVALVVEIPRAVLKIDADLECRVWSALEAGLPAVDGEELSAAVGRWFNYVNAHGDQRVVMALAKILCAVQSRDPRPNANYQGTQFCRNINVYQMKKLSVISSYFVMNIIFSFPFV
ncbi:uncharacterized protein LOC129595227 [Paramacrobiotus metropolitanus]|uniref:uncharacterized protein LOC129595227 n=1 Tax=Paramacrobiotus metropolitanus TaxID=2943436 RepID=UPI002445BD35|nr:uncharacterized protein LOC129595227 [Paramacrobiotus metropolitanus]